jgi:transcriptional antiterminator RfaH
MTGLPSQPAPAEVRWYVLRAKPHRERFVAEQLQGQGVEVFYPAVRVNPVNPRAARERAYFPGYLFVHTDLAALGANVLNYQPGAVGLLEFGGEPALVPPALIAQLKRHLANIQAAGGLALAELQPGDAVKIIAGPFEGYAAIFDVRLKGSERVRVLLELLQRQVVVELDAGQVRKLRANEKKKTDHRLR